MKYRNQTFSRIVLLLLALGLLMVVLWRINSAVENSNLLANPGFEGGDLSGWRVQGVGEARAVAGKTDDNPVLLLNIPTTNGGSWVGVGQRFAVKNLQWYRVEINYRLVFPEQSHGKVIVRISQFDKNGTLLKEEEFSNATPLAAKPVDDAKSVKWETLASTIVTHWQAATVEIGVGLLGTQMTRIEIDNPTFQIQPTWLSRLWHDPVASGGSLLLVVIVGYGAGWPVSRKIYKLIEARQVAVRPLPGWQKAVWVILLMTGLTLALTYPVGRQLSTAIAGAENWDALQHVWFQWWIKKAILDLGIWPDQVTLLYYPLMATNTIFRVTSYVPFISLPFTLMMGPVVSYNLAFLLSFILSGLAGYFLCYYLCRHGEAALIGGLIFAFFPNRFGHAVSGHLLVITNYFLPLYALSLLILLKRPSVKTMVWHGICTLMLAWSQPIHIGYGIIPVFLFIGGSKIWLLLKTRPVPWNLLKKTASALIIANLLAMILYLPFAWSMINSGTGYLETEGMSIHSTDLLAFILPSPYHPLLDKLNLAPPSYLLGINRYQDLGEPLGYLGFVALGLMGIAVWRRWPEARWWLGLTLVSAILAMGSILSVGGQQQGFVLPYNLLANVPFYSWSRTPGRLLETTMLGVAVLAALGVDSVLTKTIRTSLQLIARYALVSLLAVLILIEYVIVFPFPTETPPVSAYYYSLAKESIEGGILELPPRTISNYAMYYQTIHEHPLAGGYSGRAPAGTAELRRFFQQFLWPWPDQKVFDPLETTEIRAILADMNIQRVIAQRQYMTNESGTATLKYLPILFGSPLFKDDQILAYSVPPEARTDLRPWQLMPDQKNWSVVQNGAALHMAEDSNIYIYAAHSGQVRLEFQLMSQFSTSGFELKLNDVPIAADKSIEATRRVFQLHLQAGFNYIRLSTAPPQQIEFKKITLVDVNP